MNDEQAKVYHAYFRWRRLRCRFNGDISTESQILLDDFNRYLDQTGEEVRAGMKLFERILAASWFKKFEVDGGTYWRGIGLVAADHNATGD